MILRELFSKIVVDTKAALANVNKFDAALDQTSAGLERVEDSAKDIGKELDKSARKGKRWGDIVADAFMRGGRSAFKARGIIKDFGVGASKSLGLVVASVGAATLAAGALTIAWANNAQELDNLSKTFQISTDDLQSFTGALKVMGLDAEGGLEAIKEMRTRMGEAKREGVTPLTEGLASLGIGFKDFSAMGFIDQMGLLADRLAEVATAEEKNQILNDIAGDDLIRILPLLDKRSKGLKDLIKQTKEFGLIQDKFAIKSGAKLAKSWKFLVALGKNLVDLVASKLEPAFSAIISTTTDWIKTNDKLIAGGLADFIERLVNLAVDFLPLALDIADALLDIVENLGGVDGAIIAVIGTMATWKIATSSLLGKGGPWIAGLTGIITLLAILSAKLRTEDKNITRLANRRVLGLGFRRRGEFTSEELEQFGPGRKVLELERERKALIERREGLDVGKDIAASRAALRKQARIELGLDEGAGGGFSSGSEVRKAVEEKINEAKNLEKNIEAHRLLILEQLQLVRDEQRFIANNEERERTKGKREAASKKEEEDKVKRARQRELSAQFQRGDPKEFTKELRAELIGLIADLGIDLPEGLVLEAAAGGRKAKPKQDKEKTIRELVGLGPEGFKTIADIVPLGQGTTINNFSFSTVVQPAIVTIEVNAPEGTSALEIGQEVNSGVGQAISDSVHTDQRELIGQLQG